MKVLIRADATPAIGTGHIVRCRTLAMALRKRGAEVDLVSAAPVEMARQLAEEAGLRFLPLDVSPPAAQRQSAAAMDQDRDAHIMLSHLAKMARPNWIIVDHYQLDARWERQLRPYANHMLIIDDLFDRPHIGDVLLNQNMLDEGETRACYSELLNADCNLLSGPRYALLRPEYRDVPKRVREAVKRVLIFFGGVDPHNLTSMSIQALSRNELRSLDCDAVAGIGNPHLPSIHAQATRRRRMSVHTGLPHLADLMASADLVIGAGGATTWERLCCGLPSIIASIADNQTAIANTLAQEGAQIYAGEASELTSDALADSIIRLLQDRDRLMQLSSIGPALVDGYGAERLAEYMMPTPTEQLKLRRVRPDDISVLFDWVNDPVRRVHSLDSSPICWATHQSWLTAALQDPHCHLFILEAHGLPVGQIRFDPLDGERLRLTYFLDPIVRRRGWAGHLIGSGLAAISQFGAHETVAEVRTSNTPSIRAFKRAGFTELSDAGDDILRFSLHMQNDHLPPHLPTIGRDAGGWCPV